MTAARRVGAAASIGATGLLVGVPNVVALPSTGDTAGLVLAALGSVVGLALAVGAVALVRSDISTAHLVRVAGWNGLGVVVIGLLLVLAFLTTDATVPPYVAASVLGVSAVAHVIIGVNDVRRIRATELAREREKLAVLNRLARHNLRNDAQILTGATGVLSDNPDPDAQATVTGHVATVSDDLASMSSRLREMQAVVEDDEAPAPVVLSDLVENVASDYREEYPTVTIETAVPAVEVSATSHLATAVAHVVENALVHTDSETVRIEATVEGDAVILSVIDEGPGIPGTERTVLTGERDRTQLDHASGLGLWVVKTTVERIGGEITFGDGGGGVVRLSLPVA